LLTKRGRIGRDSKYFGKRVEEKETGAGVTGIEPLTSRPMSPGPAVVTARGWCDTLRRGARENTCKEVDFS